MGNLIWGSPPLEEIQKQIKQLYANDYRSIYPLSGVRPGIVCTLVDGQVQVLSDASASNFLDFPQVKELSQAVDQQTSEISIKRDVNLKFAPANCEIKADLPFPKALDVTVKVEIEVSRKEAYLCTSPKVFESKIQQPLKLINTLQTIPEFNDLLSQYQKRAGKQPIRFFLITDVLRCEDGIYYVSSENKGSSTAKGSVAISQVAEGQFSFGVEAAVDSGMTLTPRFSFGVKLLEIFARPLPKAGVSGVAQAQHPAVAITQPIQAEEEEGEEEARVLKRRRMQETKEEQSLEPLSLSSLNDLQAQLSQLSPAPPPTLTLVKDVFERQEEGEDNSQPTTKADNSSSQPPEKEQQQVTAFSSVTVVAGISTSSSSSSSNSELVALQAEFVLSPPKPLQAKEGQANGEESN